MTIALSANTPRVSYTVNEGASQTSFTVPFVFFTASTDLNVFVDNTARTFDASTSNTSQYTVSGGNGSTGSITTSVTGATGGSTVVITRAVPLSRTTDFPSSGAFEVAKLNTELDTVTAIQSDFNDAASRGVRLQDSDTAVSMELPLLASRKGTVLGFNASTGAAEAGPTITAVQSLSAVTASINLLGTSAVVEDMGLLATSAVIEDMGLLATSGNVTAMGLLGVSSVITDMGILGTAAIVEDMGFLGTSANVTAMGHLGTSANVTAMGKLGNDATVADMAILGTDAIVADMAILANSTIVDDLAILATSDIVTDMALLATTANVTAMGHLGTSANVTAMGLLGTSAVVTDMGILGTTAIVEDMGILATSANVTAMGLLGTSAVVEDMGLLGTAAVVEDLGLLATSAVIEDMGLLATSANVTNMATLGASGVVTNIATVASNVSGVNSFADRYRVASSAPSSSLDVGDLYFDTTANELKVYKSSGWAAAGSTVNGTSARFHYDIGSAVTSVTGSDAAGNTLAYDAGFIDVYVNGVRMSTADVTITSGDTVTFASALASGDEVDIVAFGTFAVANIVSTGALNSGSITSGFGNIDTGSSTITTTGAITGGTLEATADTSSGDNASIGYTASEGLILTGQGSTSDVTIKNDADATVMQILTGTDDVVFTDDIDLNSDGARITFGGSSETIILQHVADTGLNLQGSGTNTNFSLLSFHTSNSTVADLRLGKSSNNTVGTFEVTASGEALGQIRFTGQDSNNGTREGAMISVDQSASSTATTVPSDMKFFTTGTEQVRIHSNGVASFNSGIALGVGTANTASNVISDYEEGTFTPRVFDSADNVMNLATAAGFYTKIGRSVHINFYIVLASSGSTFAGNQIYIDGLPFTNANVSNNVNMHQMVRSNVDSTSGYHEVIAYIDQNRNYYQLLHGGDNVAYDNFRGTALSNSCQLILTAHYFVT